MHYFVSSIDEIGVILSFFFGKHVQKKIRKKLVFIIIVLLQKKIILQTEI